jgi:hypothetical protein
MSLLKNLFLFSVLFIFIGMQSNAQPGKNKYDAAWKKVEGIIEKGLPKSALEEVRKIYAWAKTDRSDAQLIKAAWYLGSLQQETRENSELLAIAEIEKELSTAKEPVASVFKSMLAGMYLNYYQKHRWELYSRTETRDFKKEDIATWSAGDFHARISSLFLQSIQAEKLLQSTRVDAFDPVIVAGNTRHLRPTLYDLLAHRALSYFENDEREITKPAYAFEIDKASAFDPAADFIHAKFPSKDTASLKHKALLTWQKLIAFHINDANPSALIDADLKRISFVKNNSTHPDKDAYYFNAINHIANQYGNAPAASQAWYLVAEWYEQNASRYKAYGDSTHRMARVKAKEILERILLQKDSSEGKINAFNLLQQVRQPSLEFQVEQVNIPEQPFRSLFTYRNLNRVYLRLVRVTDQMKDNIVNSYDEKFWPAVLSAPVFKSWEQALPGSSDMQTHSAEIKIDALPVGDYILIASGDRDFTPGKAVLGAGRFYVSRISYVSQAGNYFVLDRDNGQPLAGASVQVWESYYDYKTSKYTRRETKKFITDKNGWFKFEIESKDRSRTPVYTFDIRHKTDRLFTDRSGYDYYDYNTPRQEKPEIKNAIFMFLDRAIYRPGQEVFFKGIVLRLDPESRQNTVQPEYETTVILKDANYKDIDSIKVRTNEFGSFTAKFRLPESGLNGQFTLVTRSGNGNASFNVEEYKRPKFFVDFDPVKGTYRVDDTIRVTGFAKAYAGNNIDGAQVKYRVVRRARFPYPWYFKRGWLPQILPQEIANGIVTTDKDGKFQVSFPAIPDRTVDRKMDPVFDYVVYADVTDINGETRSGEKSISAGYKSLLLKATIPTAITPDSLRSLNIRTENMNGDFEPATVKVVMTKLRAEQRLIRDRYWERPDQFGMSKEEYVRNFPNDEYDNETDYSNWQRGEIELTRTDSTTKDGTWTLGGKQIPSGIYLVEISTVDKDGNAIKDEQYVEVYDPKNRVLSHPEYLWTGSKETTVEPGGAARIDLGTSAGEVFIIHQVIRQHWLHRDKPEFSFIELNNEKRTFTLPVKESDRGGFGAGWMFIKNNRVYQVNETIGVPWTNKELEIEYITFRDKTLPGSEEKWKLRITGYKKEIAAAELLASMYDASLDQFVTHNWYAPSVWPTYGPPTSWNTNDNFKESQSVGRGMESEEYKSLDKRYDRFFWDHDFRIYDTRITLRGARNYKNADLQSAPMAEVANAVPVAGKKDEGETGGFAEEDKAAPGNASNEGAVIRKNFNETAFFFPDLRTDEHGAIEFSFTIPEALTKWKFMALAHTKDGAFGSSTKEIVTQKELMVQPNAPRFLREGDKMEFSSKIVNLSTAEMTGTVEFRLFDAETMEPVDGAFRSMVANQYFTVAAGQSEVVKFPIEVPYLFNRALVWRIVAKSGNYSDGEENILPVLTNRMLVTETIPLHMRGTGTRVFNFDKLLASGNSETLQHHAFTLEYTSNPAWFAVQALPYLADHPNESAEQQWNRYFANSLAAYIAGSSPRIREVFERWRITDTAALVSNLQKNQELKSVLLEETPWVLQAKNETEQKRNIALLFDMVKMSAQLNISFEKLKQMQSSNGGFVWFTGGPDDRYITQYIVSGIGHLQKLGGILPGQQEKLRSILNSAIPYLDRKIKEDYDELIKSKTDLKKHNPGYHTIQYLYARSFFKDRKIAPASQAAYDYFRGRAQQSWTTESKYMQGMTALFLYRTGDEKTPAAILRSLSETAIVHEELGMYWKDQRAHGC